MPSFPFDITSPASPYFFMVFGCLTLLVIDLLLALVEGVSLTLLNWNPFRASMLVSFIMNIFSGIINSVLLILLQHNPFLWLPVSFFISVIIETFVVTFFKRGANKQNIYCVLIANLASYFLIILPAYYFGANP
jgi:hypothetical protein